MNRVLFHVIRTARDAIDSLDAERRRQGLSQMRISELADAPDVGQWYSRMYGRGDVMMSKYLRFLHATGYELVMMKREEVLKQHEE